MAKNRVNTRFTLPSRMGCDDANAKLKMAPAVDWPMPGNSTNAGNVSGKWPNELMCCAALCKFRARA